MVTSRTLGTLPIILLLCALGRIAQAGNTFPWTDLNRTKDLQAAFGNDTHSFNVTENWNICMRLVFDIPFTPDVADYAPIMSELLRILHVLGGGSIRLKKGVYPINNAISMPSHTCLVGEGPENSTLRLSDFAPSFYPYKGMVRSTYGERVSIQGVTIDGNRGNQSQNEEDLFGRDGISFKLVNYAWFRNVVFRSHSGHGADLYGSDQRWAFHGVFEGCTSTKNGKDGIRVMETFYASVSNCMLTFNEGSGLKVVGGTMHALLKRNQIEHSGGCGIKLESDSNRTTRSVHVVDNHEVDSLKAGLCMTGVAQVLVEENNVTDVTNWRSFCYDVLHTAALSISADSICRVRSRVAYNPRDEDALRLAGAPGYAPGGPPDSALAEIPAQNASPGCKAGIIDRDVCCPTVCGTCGGDGCGKKLEGGHCCYSDIKSTAASCAAGGENPSPPCVLGAYASGVSVVLG